MCTKVVLYTSMYIHTELHSIELHSIPFHSIPYIHAVYKSIKYTPI